MCFPEQRFLMTSREGVASDTTLEQAVNIAIDFVETRYAPDDRVTCFDIRSTIDEETVALEGTVQTDCIRYGVNRTVEAIRGVGSIRDDLTVLEGNGRLATVRRSIGPVYGAPSDDAEQVTQVLYGAALTAFDESDGWRRVRTPDGYLGWIDERSTTAIDAKSDDTTDAVVTTASVPLRQDSCSPDVPEILYAGTPCRLESSEDGQATISFRTGARVTLPADSIAVLEGIDTSADPVSVAEQFLGTPYEWGGMINEGIDCSGLVWIAYACTGVELPRDTDQQERVGADVERGELEPGDLLFFPGHVAIYLSNSGSKYIHAYGNAGEVTVNSLDPSSDDYIADLDESLRTVKRLVR